MNVGDLVREKGFPEVGVVIKINERRYPREPYGILCPSGKIEWFTKAYIEEECEVISESR